MGIRKMELSNPQSRGEGFLEPALVVVVRGIGPETICLGVKSITGDTKQAESGLEPAQKVPAATSRTCRKTLAHAASPSFRPIVNSDGGGAMSDGKGDDMRMVIIPQWRAKQLGQHCITSRTE